VNIKTAFLPLAVILSTLSAPANSAQYTFTGQVQSVVTTDSNLGSNLDYISISGASSAGQCYVADGLVVIRMRDDLRGQRQFALALAAKLSGTPLTVVLDDINQRGSDGFCYVRVLY